MLKKTAYFLFLLPISLLFTSCKHQASEVNRNIASLQQGVFITLAILAAVLIIAGFWYWEKQRIAIQKSIEIAINTAKRKKGADLSEKEENTIRQKLHKTSYAGGCMMLGGIIFIILLIIKLKF